MIKKREHCPVCYGKKEKNISHFIRDDHYLTSTGSKVKPEIRKKVELSLCCGCGLVYFSEYSEKLEQLYREFYRMNEDFESKSRHEENSIKNYLWWGLLKNILTALPNKTVLDIGCAEGFWVQFLNLKGFQAEGIELNQKSVEYARKKRLLIYDHDILRHKKKYDFIFTSGYFEHVEEPRRVLEHIRDVCLNEDGYLYIGTPNLFCPNTINLSEFFPAEHLQMFSPDVLSLFLENMGFKINFHINDVYNHGQAILAQKTDKIPNPKTISEKGWNPQANEVEFRLYQLKKAHELKEPLTTFLRYKHHFKKNAAISNEGNYFRASVSIKLLETLSLDMFMRVFFKMKEKIEKDGFLVV